MSRLDDRLLNHGVHAQIARVRELLSQLPEETEREADERLDGALERAPMVLDHLETLLSSADPQLVTVSALDQLAGPLDQAIGALTALAGDPDQISQLDSAMETVLASSQALAVASQLPRDLSEAAVENFGASLRSRAEALTEEAEGIRESLETLRAERNLLEQESRESADQRRNELQGEIDRITEAINAEKGRLDSLVPNFETQFNQVQESRAEEWKTLRQELEEKITGTRDELEGQAKQALSSIQEQSTATAESVQQQAESVLEEVRGKRDEVVKLYGIIGDTGTAGAFAKEADNQKKAADFWRWVAIGAGIVTLFLAAGAVAFSALSEDTSLGSHLASLVVAGAAGGLTAYAARQSGHHRDREDESRRIELELTAFGPFTSELGEPDKARSAYAERLFKGADRVPGGEPTISRDQVTLVQTLIESVLKARA